MPELRQPLKPGVTGIRQGRVRVPVVRQSFLLMNPCARVVVPKGTFGVETACNGHSLLLVTSIMLYLPANILPIMVTDLLGSKMPSTILAGVILLWSEGSYPVAAVIFLASN